ncbi:MAG: IclR family transcriptional regulator [Microbacteriaceae bacterium]
MAHTEIVVDAGSQTLSRGLTALSEIAHAAAPMSISGLAQRLGIHRSMAYRMVSTLEQHGFVERDSSGRVVLGLALLMLSRGIAQSLHIAAERELAEVANELQMTAFLSMLDGGEAVTMYSVVPHAADTTVAHRPGSRHSIDAGAPGRVIRSQVDPDSFPPQRFEYSQNEVLPGLASIAVPLQLVRGRAASVAVVFPPQDVDERGIAETLARAAQRIAASVG